MHFEKTGLNALSSAYYDKSEIYLKFSQAEDAPDLIWAELKALVTGCTLDLGCGNAKYTHKLQLSGVSTVGVDLAINQLKRAPEDVKNLICGSATQLCFPESVFDTILSCWVWGTLKESDRDLAFAESKRVLKENGTIFLVENTLFSEFDRLRGHVDVNGPAFEYNQWLIKNGFEIVKSINTYFLFDSAFQAQEVFKSIWGERLKNADLLALSNKISHDVSIWRYCA